VRELIGTGCRVRVAVVAATATVAVCMQVGDASARSHSCAAPRGERVVARTTNVIVTRSGGTYRTCYRPTGARRVLIRNFNSGSPDYGTSGTVLSVLAAGPYALYELYTVASNVADPMNSESTTVQVVDVARHDAPTLSINDDNGTLGFRQIALSSDGYLAWDQISYVVTPTTEEIAATTGSGTQVLDSTQVSGMSTPDPFSHLAFQRQTVTWLDHGTPRTASP
jgi:hypothetical protein